VKTGINYKIKRTDALSLKDGGFGIFFPFSFCFLSQRPACDENLSFFHPAAAPNAAGDGERTDRQHHTVLVRGRATP
jgi:hypothetical protein